MAHKVFDLAQQLTTGTGTGALTLGAVPAGCIGFADQGAIAGDTFWGCIRHLTANEVEVTLCTIVGDGTITRAATPLISTTGSKINFSAGTKTITCVAPGLKSVVMDPNGDAAVTRNLAVGYQLTAQGNVTFGSSLNLTLPHTAGGPLNFADSAVGGQTMQIGWGAGNAAQTFNFYNVDSNNYPIAIRTDGAVGYGTTPEAATTSKIHSAGDVSLYGGGRAVMFNAYYAGGWKYAANGYPFVIRDDANGYVHFYGGALNSSGNGASLSPQGIVSLNLLTPCLFPFTDNTVPLGAALNRWSVVYAGTGSINTSGQADKLDVVEASAAEREWARLIRGRGPKRYKFKDAVDAKGDAARWHFGYVVEDILADAETAGIVDPWRYAFLCRDRKIVREAYTETEMREKRRTVTVEETAIEIRDGVPVQLRKSVEREERVGAMVALQDEQGNPVVREVRDEKGNVTGTAPLMHFVPEMEEVEVERFREVETDEWQYGLRYSELEAFLACAA